VVSSRILPIVIAVPNAKSSGFIDFNTFEKVQKATIALFIHTNRFHIKPTTPVIQTETSIKFLMSFGCSCVHSAKLLIIGVISSNNCSITGTNASHIFTFAL
jgi:hypothetical protein